MKIVGPVIVHASDGDLAYFVGHLTETNIAAMRPRIRDAAERLQEVLPDCPTREQCESYSLIAYLAIAGMSEEESRALIERILYPDLN